MYIIKRYLNRKLYDVQESKYVTIVDIKNLIVNDNKDVVIVDHLKEDITGYILLQIIANDERNRKNVDLLKSIIKKGLTQ